MRKIFFNGKIKTLNHRQSELDAVLVNDGSIVYVGNLDEILSMKKDDDELIDLNQKQVYPTCFNLKCRIFDLIEEEIKNAKKFKNLENINDFDENYENFDNYDIYKKEFIKLQKGFLNKGISTIQEVNINAKEFTFWKKPAEEKLLDIDVVGYVDINKSKNVMDDNCVSFRKSKNGFRLGGFSLSLDGTISEKQAYISFNYKHEKNYKGYLEFFDEQLIYFLKTALDEKKQLVIEANGDASVEQLIRCFKIAKHEKQIEDVYRPIVFGCGFLKKNQIKQIKEIGFIPSFQLLDLINNKSKLKNAVGKRIYKMFPLKKLEKLNIPFLINTSNLEFFDFFEQKNLFSNLKLSRIQSFNLHNLDEILIRNSAYALFEENQNATLENGKKANFVVLNDKNKIEATYILGEKK